MAGPVTHIFDVILSQEECFGVSKLALEQWHMLIKGSLTGSLKHQDILKMFLDIHRPGTWHIAKWALCWYYTRKIDACLSTLLNNKKFKKSITDFYLNFNNLCVHLWCNDN